MSSCKHQWLTIRIVIHTAIHVVIRTVIRVVIHIIYVVIRIIIRIVIHIVIPIIQFVPIILILAISSGRNLRILSKFCEREQFCCSNRAEQAIIFCSMRAESVAFSVCCSMRMILLWQTARFSWTLASSTRLNGAQERLQTDWISILYAPSWHRQENNTLNFNFLSTGTPTHCTICHL